jgi:glycosyltransferase involved in cell wall biosynthesis
MKSSLRGSDIGLIGHLEVSCAAPKHQIGKEAKEFPMPDATPPRLSALIVAHNEEDTLASCLDSVRFCDEIVVVLDRCTDGSGAIARQFTDRVIEGAWPVEGDRRNLGIENCTGDWVLELDADEHVSPALRDELPGFLASTKADYAFIPFLNFIGQRAVPHGWGAYNSVTRKACLFKRAHKNWGLEAIHPSFKVTGTSASLQQVIHHFVDRDFTDMLNRLNRYTSAYARQLVTELVSGKRKPESTGRWVRRAFGRGWKSYVARKGYREGYTGVMLALFAALYPLLSHLKANEILDAAKKADYRS